MSTPVSGWYPDPNGGGGHRYWDGSAWTEHVSPVPGSTWGQPAPAAPDPGPASGAYGTYQAQTQPLTVSGMRRVPELFNDVGRILRRAWWPITAISLIVWFVWLAVCGIAAAVLVDFSRLQNALSLLTDTLNQYDQSRIPRVVSLQIEDAFTGSLRTQSPWVWGAVGLVLILLTVWASTFHIAAVNRLAIDAASGQPVALSASWSSGLRGGTRLFGYALLWALAVIAALAVVSGLVGLAAWVSVPLAVLVAVLAGVAYLALGLWLLGRLVPVLVQAVVAPGALRWSWNATRGKFWAVLGRYLLWAVVASVLSQVVLSVIMVPFSFGAVAVSANPSGSGWVWLGLLYLLTVPLSMAVAAVTYIGIVPIWRDLSDQPQYQSITPDGQLVPTS